MKKKLAVILTAVLSACWLSGCSTSNVPPKKENQTINQTVQESTTKPNQTDSFDMEQEKKSDAAILVVSFGTSYNDSRDITIGAIEEAISQAYPEYEVRRAFTSQIIIDILKNRENLEIDNVTEALDRAVTDGIKELMVQPTHLMSGFEYNDLLAELTEYLDKFDKIILADPLLMSDADFDAVIEAITERTASYDDGETAICFMGHGTEAKSNQVYAILQDKLIKKGYENYYIGTVEAAPTLDDIAAALKVKGIYKKVVLEPLMVVSGDHANNDMAGEEEDSWKTILEKEGYEVTCIMEGLGQMETIQNIYIAHLKKSIDSGSVFEGIEITEPNIKISHLTDGIYHIKVESSSSMFKIEKAELTVVGEDITAIITLSGTGYGKLYMGTAEEAAAADESEYITFVEDADGAYTYTLPTVKLDQPIACAAYSSKKEEWYDRQITFLSASISTDTVGTETAADNSNIEITPVKATEGTYLIEVTLEGGSGKSTVLSPAVITVAENSITATIEWNSSNYDYMLVNGEKYFPVNTEGNAVFKIPVAELDTACEVIADTVAMSKPHEIEYTLTFHSNTMKAAELE